MATGTIILPIFGGISDATNPPGYGILTGVGRPYLVFDNTTDELVLWTFTVPADFASGLNINVGYSFLVATSTNVCRVRSQIMCAADGVEIDVDSLATLEDSGDVTIPGTAGLRDTVSYAPSNTDSIAANSHCTIQLGRENAVTGTNAAEDMYWWDVWLTYTTS